MIASFDTIMQVIFFGPKGVPNIHIIPPGRIQTHDPLLRHSTGKAETGSLRARVYADRHKAGGPLGQGLRVTRRELCGMRRWGK